MTKNTKPQNSVATDAPSTATGGGAGQNSGAETTAAAAGSTDSSGASTVPVAQGLVQQPGTNSTSADTAIAAAAGGPATPLPDVKRRFFVRSVHIRHDGRVYGPGDEIELTFAQAERLSGLVKAAGTPF